MLLQVAEQGVHQQVYSGRVRVQPRRGVERRGDERRCGDSQRDARDRRRRGRAAAARSRQTRGSHSRRQLEQRERNRIVAVRHQRTARQPAHATRQAAPRAEQALSPTIAQGKRFEYSN